MAGGSLKKFAPVIRPVIDGTDITALLNQRPLSGVEQTSIGRCKMSDDDPKRKLNENFAVMHNAD